jgi:hypothetical protein
MRIGNALVTRRMGWDAIGDAEREAIKKVVVANIDAIIEGVSP